MSNLSLEVLYEVWDDKNGSVIEIGPDRDGLEMIEIRRKDDSGEISDRMTFTFEEADLVSVAIERCLCDAKEKSGNR